MTHTTTRGGEVMITSIDREIDAAARYALRVLHRERRQPSRQPGRKESAPRQRKEGTICNQGCCEWRDGLWKCIGERV